ncbi:MAG: T9SS type A sorting domain-containing protein [Bacteroidales bacterium]
MKTREIFTFLFTLFTFVLFTFNSSSQPPDILWYKQYGNTMDDIAFDAIEADDGEYIVIGKTEITDNNWDAWVAKLDNNGDIIWENTIGGAEDEQVVSIWPGLYSGYVLTGYTSTGSNGLSDIWILYIDDNGDSIASAKYGSWSSDQGFCIRPNVDQGFIVSSRSTIFQWGDQIHLMKLDASLDTMWTKLYGGPKQDYGHMVEETSDYGYIIAGRTYTTVYPESGDAWAIKTDNNGDTVWTKKYGGDDEDIFYAVVETEDGYIFAGQTWSFGAGLIDVYVVRTDDDGNVIWSETYGGTGADYAYRIFETEDGNYMISGYSDSFSGSQDVYMVKIDGNGNLLWEEFYGNSYDGEYMYGGSPTSDGGYILAGKLDLYTQVMHDLFVLKVGPEITGIDRALDIGNGHFYCYPNPTETATSFHFDLQGNGFIEIVIYDAFGREVETLRTSHNNPSINEISWDTSSLPVGVYYCYLRSEEKTAVCKTIVSR